MQDAPDKVAEGQSSSQLSLAVLMAVAAMISVQLGAALARPAMDSFGPFAVTWGRLAWAALLLWLVVRPISAATGHGTWLPQSHWAPQSRS
ncbi:hypothetical protein [Mesorhizobium sp. Pch-S]|uniref:hypothetical protein n=1 Tax=Mesorhizobium sp. Pch-S TaxID=2082387 RepID=UPI001A929DD2|nr:hypothetical protein [Mesorhizobium sp. Pch-S]